MSEHLEFKKLVSRIEDQDKEIDSLKKLLAATRASILNLDKKSKRNSDEIRRQSSDIILLKSRLSK
jgi:hypothetical protein